MDQWQCKEVGDGVAAFQPAMDLHKAFMQLALANGGHVEKGLGVWSFYDVSENMVTWYFSPEATTLANQFAASPCEKPTPAAGFSLLAGDGRSWEVHFPGYVPGGRRR